jgi:hypothetical protein
MVNPKFCQKNPEDKSSSSNDDDEIFKFYSETLGDQISPKSSLLMTCKLKHAAQIIVKNLKIIPGWEVLATDVEFILRTCNLIENIGILKRDKISKKEVFLKTYHELYDNLTENDLKAINNNIEFLLDKKLVKKILLRKKIVRFVKLNLLPDFFL